MAFNWNKSSSWVKPNNYITMPEPVNIRKNQYPLTSGFLIIESDDNKEKDYTLYFKLLKEISHNYSQFFPYNLAFACPAVNSQRIGDTGSLSWEQVKELHDYGWEINSHGRHHVGIGKHSVQQSISVGDTRIYIEWASYTGGQNIYTWRIWEDTKEETFKITNIGDGYIDIDVQLQNSYTINANVQITQASAYEDLQGCIDDLNAQGIDTKHHVYTYFSGSMQNYSIDAVNWISNIFESGAGRNQNINNLSTNRHNLYRNALSRTYSNIDTDLQNVKDNNGVLIYYGHADSENKLEYIVEKAIEMGIKIINTEEMRNTLFNI